MRIKALPVLLIACGPAVASCSKKDVKGPENDMHWQRRNRYSE